MYFYLANLISTQAILGDISKGKLTGSELVASRSRVIGSSENITGSGAYGYEKCVFHIGWGFCVSNKLDVILN